MDKYSHLQKKFKEFLVSKMLDPLSAFGSKDRPFVHDKLKGNWHAGLNHDISLIYFKKPMEDGSMGIYLCMVGTHDDIGTGNPANQKRQLQTRQKIDNQRFDPFQLQV